MTTGAILASIGDVVQASVSWMQDIISFVESSPLVMIFVTISLVGLGIGLLSRVLGLRG